MVFMKKVSKSKQENLEKLREEFIAKADKSSIKNEWMRILLRIKSDDVQQIDEEIKSRMGMTRTSWILEAIQEKLQKEAL